MKRIALALLLSGVVGLSCGAAGSGYSNLAFRRVAYHSSAADFNRTGHLVADGSLAGIDARFTVFSGLDADRSPAGERPVKAFDGNADTKWLAFASSSWLQVDASAPLRPASYSLTSANDDPGRDPKAWKLLGSDDGVKFVELDARADQDFAGRREKKTFPLDLKRAYRVFRLHILDNHGDPGWNGSGTRIQLAEFDLLGAKGETLVRNDKSTGGYVSAWASKGAEDEWVRIDLGAPGEIDRVKLDWCTDGFATVYDIQVSDDARQWRTVAGKADGKGGHEELEFPKTAARHVRVFCRKTDSDHFALAEVQVMGKGGPGPYATEGGWRVQRASEVSAKGEEIASERYDDKAWLPAVVPGTVLTSYFKAGAIPDMNIADNQLQISDSFFTADFWYRRTFAIKAPAKGGRVWLNFEAINWKADVYLNGVALGRIDGAFLRKSFDVTKIARFKGDNHLAVFIHKNDNPGDVTLQDRHNPGKNGGVLGRDNPTIHASIGWDWVPTVRGRNIGIYRDVTVTYTGDVTLKNGWAVTELDVEGKDFSKAEVTLRVQAHNASDAPVTAVLEGTVEPGGYKVKGGPVALAAGETKEVVVGSFTMQAPKLWWPATYGAQPLYAAKIVASVDGKASEAHDFKFGVRKFTFKKDKPMEVHCNGVRIVCRGGNWGMDDANLAATPADYDTKVRLHAEANLTMIRNWVGMTNSKDFYDACDKYGVLIFDDFWLANPSDGPDPKDVEMFLENARDKVLKNRHHAAIAFYCGRNEGNPPKSLFDALPKLVEELDGTRHYIPHSAGGTVSGFGPYGVRDPKWYFKNAPVTLHSERGQPNIPEIESMTAMLGPDHLWPIDDVWGQHDFTGGGAQGCNGFKDYIRRSYAEPDNLRDFTRLAQFVEYENHKAMFESVYAVGGNGILMWMSQSAWPSMVWQTYDYWHDVNGGYYGAKAGNQPVNVILNQDTMKFFAVNATGGDLAGARVAVEFRDSAGRVLKRLEEALSLPADSRKDLFDLPELDTADGVLLIRATVVSAKGAGLAENFTWVNVKKDRDYKALLPLVGGEPTLSGVKIAKRGNGAAGVATVANKSDRPMLLVRLRLVDSKGRRVLPVHWSDNYVSLMPGEERTIRFEATDVSAAVGELKVVSPDPEFGKPEKIDWAFGPFVRPAGVNPVIKPNPASVFPCPMRKRDLKWEESDTFNPAAAVKDGRICVLYRAEDNTFQGVGSRTSRLGYAETTDGFTMKRDPAPVLFPCEDDQKEFDWEGGCEDPRIAVTEDGLYVCTYTSWNKKVARLCVATSRDLKTWRKHGPAFAKAEGGKWKDKFCKSGAIVQGPSAKDPSRYVITRVNGKYVMYWGEQSLEWAVSDNLVDWTPKGNVIRPRRGFFDSSLTEMGPAAIITPHGIVVLYNGKNSGNRNDADARYPLGTYCGGQILCSIDDPSKVLGRLREPYFRPEADFEKTGQYKDGTVFTEGLVFYKGKWHLYYGCADSFVGYAVWDPK